MRGIFLFLILFANAVSFSQTCTTLGQNPATAFPVCGTTIFTQSQVPVCGGRDVPGPCTNGITDKNPFWYRFTCFTSGTLGFEITPLILAEDYDWQLFDITGRNPNDVFTDRNLFVACNWSAEFGITGASSAGTSLVRCDGPGVPLFSAMPNIIAGRTYILLISHFTDTQSGYNLSFGGGTASITDPIEPKLLNADAICDGTRVRVVFNKKMKCNSLSANGSEFTISPAVTNVIATSGYGCTSSFDMDSVILTLNNPLPPGTYNISIKNGSDGNTILDNCGRSIPENDQVQVVIIPLVPTPMDSIQPVACAPDKITLVFRKKIRCSSVAANGSDFIINGTNPVTIISAAGNCDTDGLSYTIDVKFSQPIQTLGNYTIILQTGTDGNTIIDECGQITPAGSRLNFSTKDTVNAKFTFNIGYGCITDTINYFHNGLNGVNTWTWLFDSIRISTVQNPQIYYAVFGPKRTDLIVSNGVCSDTSSANILLDNVLMADFIFPDVVCPRETAKFRDTSVGNIQSWLWEFGNGSTSNQPFPPPQQYPEPVSNIQIPVKLTVTNNYGCSNSITHLLLVVNNCYIAVPSAFTPNGDGLNDFLYPLNAYKTRDLTFSIFNRFGQRIFNTNSWLNKWNGKFGNRDSDPGTYVWFLKYTDIDTNKSFFLKGTSILIR